MAPLRPKIGCVVAACSRVRRAGKKQFDVDQAIFLAQCGYTAVAVEERQDRGYERDPSMASGRDVLIEHTKRSFAAMTELRADVGKMRGIAAATLTAARQHRAAHTHHAAAIGYCFGGCAPCLLHQDRFQRW